MEKENEKLSEESNGISEKELIYLDKLIKVSLKDIEQSLKELEDIVEPISQLREKTMEAEDVDKIKSYIVFSEKISSGLIDELRKIGEKFSELSTNMEEFEKNIKVFSERAGKKESIEKMASHINFLKMMNEMTGELLILVENINKEQYFRTKSLELIGKFDNDDGPYFFDSESIKAEKIPNI